MNSAFPGGMSKALFVLVAGGLAALAGSAVLYLLGMPQDGYVFLAGIISVLLAGVISAFRREGGARLEDALTLLVGIAFFVWIAWRTISR